MSSPSGVEARRLVRQWRKRLRRWWKPIRRWRKRLRRWNKRRRRGHLRYLLRLRLVRSVVSSLMVIALVEAIANLVNPFGMDDAIKAHAGLILQRVSAPFYGGSTWHFWTDHPKPIGQDKVTVVLIDENYFAEHRHEGSGNHPVWPLPVAQFTSIIGQIIDADPAALFVDIALPDAPREITSGSSNSREQALHELADRLRQLQADRDRKHEVPVFLSDVMVPTASQRRAYARCGTRYIPEKELRKTGLLAPGLSDQLFGTPNLAPPWLEVVNSASIDASGNYDLATLASGPPDACTHTDRQAANYIVSPALALYKAYAGAGNEASAGTLDCNAAKHLPLTYRILRKGTLADSGYHAYQLCPPANEQLSPRWGISMSDTMLSTFGSSEGRDDCDHQFDENGNEGSRMYLGYVVQPVSLRLRSLLRRRCAYIDTISAAHLTNPPHDNGPVGSETLKRFRRRFLAGRIVLLGASIPQAQDRFTSPVNGDMPGVYQHAVAVENLVSDDARFRRSNPSALLQMTLLLVVVLVTAVTRWWWHGCCRWLSAVAPPLGEFVLAPLLYVALIGPAGVLLLAFLFWFTVLPLTEIAVPLIVIHLILFGGLLEGIDERLREWLERKGTTNRARSHR